MAMKGLRWALNATVWTQTSQEWCQAMACIQEEEKTRINQFVFADDATLSLLGRLLLRAAIIQVAAGTVSNNQIKMGRTEKGRPYVIFPHGLDEFDFNISHQGNYAVLAAEENRRVGVDVMQLTRPRGVGSVQEFFKTMNRQFTNNEWKQIQAPPTNEQRLASFYRHWCLKESYIKAIGIGISHGLQRIEFNLGKHPWGHQQGGVYKDSEVVCSDTVVTVDGRRLTDDWVFEESLLDDKHCVAVAIEQPHPPPRPLNQDCYKPQPFQQLTVPFLLSKLTPLSDTHSEHNWLLQRDRPTK